MKPIISVPAVAVVATSIALWVPAAAAKPRIGTTGLQVVQVKAKRRKEEQDERRFTEAENTLRAVLRQSVRTGHARCVAHAVGIYPA